MLVLGDCHANNTQNRQYLFAAYRAANDDIALQVGDLYYYNLPIPTYFIAGNNEDFDVIEALRHGRIKSENVENAILLHSTAEEIQGLRIGGVSGNYAPTRFDYSRDELSNDRRRHFVHEDVEAAKNLHDIDIFLAHEAPHGLPVSEEYDVGCKYIDQILETIKPRLCLVGHHHEHAETTFGETKVISLEPVWQSYYHLDSETLELSKYQTPQV
ncbi:MAG: metallophosphoesterase [Halobacteriaceae archaeon]